eukprot:6842845-Prymnesium_polylepis.1
MLHPRDKHIVLVCSVHKHCRCTPFVRRRRRGSAVSELAFTVALCRGVGVVNAESRAFQNQRLNRML